MTTIEERVDAIMSAVVSHALGTGLFTAVNGAEPDSAPPDPQGITAAIWVQDIGPASGTSGLSATTARLELQARLETSAQTVPRDAIDPALLRATCRLLDAYSGDFTLDDLVRDVDLLGAHGDPLCGRAGWLRYPDGPALRVMQLVIPMIVDDLWGQTA